MRTSLRTPIVRAIPRVSIARSLVCLSLLLALLVIAPGTSRAQEEAAERANEPPAFVPGSFTLAILPDTQYYHKKDYLHHFLKQTEWIAENAEKYNIAYVLTLGDITQDNIPEEWENAKRAFSTLDDAGIPYVIAYGNHDYYRRLGDDPKRPCLGNEYFTTEEFAKWPTYGGVMQEGKMDNNYHLFEANGIKFVVISLQWSPPDTAVKWADTVLTEHADRKAIFITHGYLYNDDTRYDRTTKQGEQKWAPGKNDGEALWQNLLKKHANVFLVLCGHVLGDGTGLLTSTGDHGNEVHQILCNYQMLPQGGSGYMRILEIRPDGKSMQMKAYSPSLDVYKTEPDHQFELELDW